MYRGVYKLKEKIFVPQKARKTIIKLYHEGMTEGHPGQKGIQQDIEKFATNARETKKRTTSLTEKCKAKRFQKRHGNRSLSTL